MPIPAYGHVYLEMYILHLEYIFLIIYWWIRIFKILPTTDKICSHGWGGFFQDKCDVMQFLCSVADKKFL